MSEGPGEVPGWGAGPSGMGHPVLATVGTVSAALKDVADVPVTFLDTTDKRTALLGLAEAEAQLVALRLRVMAGAEDVADAEAARDIGAWWAHHTRDDAATARGEQRLAHALEHRWTRVAAALGQGGLNLAQAMVITRGLDELPATLGAGVLAEAEAHLVAQAAHFGPRELRLLGRRILEVVAPEVAEQHEADQLAKEEEHARRRTSLSSKRLGDGSTRISIHLPDADAARLHTYLEAFTSPRHDQTTPGAAQGGLGEGDRIPIDRKRGQAFCALLETIDPHRLPVHGGDATTLIVTIDLADLARDLDDTLGAGDFGPTGKLTAGQARRLACAASIIPAVLGAKSEILDLGRTRRLFSPAQRKAMVLRDRECRTEGCTIPAAWCEAHHANRPWTAGGRTDLADGLLLCS